MKGGETNLDNRLSLCEYLFSEAMHALDLRDGRNGNVDGNGAIQNVIIALIGVAEDEVADAHAAVEARAVATTTSATREDEK